MTAARRQARPSRLLYRIIRLPGWTAIGTGLAQLAILISCTLYGAANRQYDAIRQYQQQQTELAERAKEIKKELSRLAVEMQKLIKQYQLQAEPQADPPPVVAELPPLQPAQPEVMDRETAMGVYKAMRREYVRLSAQFKEVNQELVDMHRPGMADVFGYLKTSLVYSSLTSAALPMLVAYIYWVTGTAMVTVGLFYLIFAKRFGPAVEL
jgi:hypothetical protein